jgi:LPS export ABC transporter protein LptC
VLLISGCTLGRSRTSEALSQGSSDIQKFENSLTFDNVVLEQADEQGKLWWKIKAIQATYSRDQKQATVQKPEGELYQDGKVVFKLVAAKGEVIQDGKSILLKGQIQVTDVRDGRVLKGKEIEWQPNQDLLIVRHQFSATQKQMTLTADEGRFFSRKREAEITGKVVADTKQPDLKLKTTRLQWFLDKQLVTADQPLQIERFVNGQLSDRATADQGRVDLKAKTAALTQNAKVFAQAQNLQASSNQLLWTLEQKKISTDQPLTLVNPSRQITLTADCGSLDLEQQTALLTGNVRGVAAKNQATVRANTLTWFLVDQSFEATGNVAYSQTNPNLNLVGNRASGTLQDQQVQVTGGPGSDNRVITEIVPPVNR